MQLQDVRGKLVCNVIDDQESEVIQSITIKDIENQGEKAIVWFGVHGEDTYIPVEYLDIDLMINILEAMENELICITQ